MQIFSNAKRVAGVAARWTKKKQRLMNLKITSAHQKYDATLSVQVAPVVGWAISKSMVPWQHRTRRISVPAEPKSSTPHTSSFSSFASFGTPTVHRNAHVCFGEPSRWQANVAFVSFARSAPRNLTSTPDGSCFMHCSTVPPSAALVGSIPSMLSYLRSTPVAVCLNLRILNKKEQQHNSVASYITGSGVHHLPAPDHSAALRALRLSFQDAVASHETAACSFASPVTSITSKNPLNADSDPLVLNGSSIISTRLIIVPIDLLQRKTLSPAKVQVMFHCPSGNTLPCPSCSPKRVWALAIRSRRAEHTDVFQWAHVSGSNTLKW